MATPWYTSRESALAALDAADSARTHKKLDQAIAAATVRATVAGEGTAVEVHAVVK